MAKIIIGADLTDTFDSKSITKTSNGYFTQALTKQGTTEYITFDQVKEGINSNFPNYKEIVASDYKEENNEQVITYKIPASNNVLVNLFSSNGQTYASNQPVIFTLSDASITSNNFTNVAIYENKLYYMIIKINLSWDADRQNYNIIFHGYFYVNENDSWKKTMDNPNINLPKNIFVKDVSALKIKIWETKGIA